MNEKNLIEKILSGDLFLSNPFVESIIANWVSEVTIFVSVALSLFLHNRIKKARIHVLYKIIVVQSLYILLFSATVSAIKIEAGFLLMTILFSPIISIPWIFLRDFSKLGIISAFTKSSEGIDIDNSLRQVSHNTLRFLGIGASKLTESREFQAAMEKCAKHGKQARFLLSPPNNPTLDAMATQNGTNPDIYKNNVRDSLRKLHRMKKEQGLDIEVRFYRTSTGHNYQRFRVFMVEDDFCLLSWTVWGGHLGKDNPQILIRKPKDTGMPANSLYKALQDYFDEQWDAGIVVDLDNLNSVPGFTP